MRAASSPAFAVPVAATSGAAAVLIASLGAADPEDDAAFVFTAPELLDGAEPDGDEELW